MPPRLLLILAVAGTASLAVPAFATTLGGGGSPDAAVGRGTVISCDSTLTTSYATSAGNLTTATVAGIADPACSGRSLRVTVVDAAGALLTSGGPATVPSDGDTVDDTVVVTLTAGAAARDAAGAHVAIGGTP